MKWWAGPFGGILRIALIQGIQGLHHQWRGGEPPPRIFSLLLAQCALCSASFLWRSNNVAMWRFMCRQMGQKSGKISHISNAYPLFFDVMRDMNASQPLGSFRLFMVVCRLRYALDNVQSRTETWFGTERVVYGLRSLEMNIQEHYYIVVKRPFRVVWIQYETLIKLCSIRDARKKRGREFGFVGSYVRLYL